MKPVILAVLFVLGGCFSISAQDKPLEKPKALITKQAFADRLAGLEKGRNQALADLQAYDGAIQECQYWIDQMTAQEKAEKESKAEQKPAADAKKSPEVKTVPKKEEKKSP